MALGISHCLASIEALKLLGIHCAQIIRALIANPKDVMSYFKLMQVAADLWQMIKEIMAAIPEIKDLDGEETKQLVGAAIAAGEAIWAAALGQALASK